MRTRDGLFFAVLLLPLLVVAAAAGGGGGGGVARLFVPTARYPCFRQPVLIPAGGGDHAAVLLAFAENRNVMACAPDFPAKTRAKTRAKTMPKMPNEVGSLHLRRSTDGGRTFSAMQTLFVGNIDFYSGVFDDSTGRTWLFLEAAGQAADPTGVQVLYSDDAGETWQDPEPLPASAVPPPPFSPNVKPTVGHGIQMASGRLVIPFVCTNTSASGGGGGDKGACPQCQSCLLVSDDAGKTWKFTTAYGQSGSRESVVVETLPGCLFASERNFGPTPGHRMWARSTDGGDTYSSFGLNLGLDTPVTDHWTGIVGAVASLGIAGAPQSLAFASAASPNVRANMTVKTSSDGGASWVPTGVQVWDGPAGYADMVSFGSGKLGVLFEGGTNTFADWIGFAELNATSLFGDL